MTRPPPTHPSTHPRPGSLRTGELGTPKERNSKREGKRETLLALTIAHRIMSMMLTERVNTAGKINRLTAGGGEDGVQVHVWLTGW